MSSHCPSCCFEMPVVTKPTKFSQGIVVSGGKTDTTWMVFDSDLLELDGKKFVQLTPSVRALTRLLCGDGDEKVVLEKALNMLKTKALMIRSDRLHCIWL